jgi:hypothetical protein
MTCDSARELLSDYLEGCLDRAAASAIELHLVSCTGCARETEGLRATWEELDAMPVVAAPPDLAPRVLAELHRQRAAAERAAAARAPLFEAPPAGPSPWLLWLRSLSPVRVALASSAATLIIAGALVFPQVPGRAFGWIFDRSRAPEGTSPLAQTRPTLPQVTIGYLNGAAPDCQNLEVTVWAGQSLPDAEVNITAPETNQLLGRGQGSMAHGQAVRTPVMVPRAETASAALRVEVSSRTANFRHDFYCVIPLQRGASEDEISVTLAQTPLYDALRQMAEKTGRPVVFDTALLAPPVTATVIAQPPDQAWRQVLPAGIQARKVAETYQVVGAGGG